jgi:hypothetical protein
MRNRRISENVKEWASLKVHEKTLRKKEISNISRQNSANDERFRKFHRYD